MNVLLQYGFSAGGCPVLPEKAIASRMFNG